MRWTNGYKPLKRIWAVVQKETIQLVRDWRALVLVLLLPLLEMFLFAYAVSLTLDHIPTVVADQSTDVRSRDFVDALVASGYFDVAMYVEDEAEVMWAIDEGLVKAGVVIPPDFAARVERGDGQVLVILDGSDSTSVSSGYSAASAVAQAQALDLTVEKVSRMGANLGTVGSVGALPTLAAWSSAFSSL